MNRIWRPIFVKSLVEGTQKRFVAACVGGVEAEACSSSIFEGRYSPRVSESIQGLSAQISPPPASNIILTRPCLSGAQPLRVVHIYVGGMSVGRTRRPRVLVDIPSSAFRYTFLNK
jgi:hypothetical protein